MTPVRIKKTRSKENRSTEPVRYSFPEGPSGPIAIQIDYALLPAPPSYFYADYVFVQREAQVGMATIQFGRTQHQKVQSRIEVVMPESSLFGQFWNSLGNVEAVIDKQLASRRQTGSAAKPTLEPQRSTTLYANNAFLAVGSGECSLDLYYLSPRDIHLAKTRRMALTLHPIIRIIMPSIAVKELLNQVRPYAESMKSVSESR